eukprot:FR741423.1.p1 GENE.FR741423.1~~FR741423.1.p1  ORF type:complete len:181 (+),score=14.47 FR741423.1:286-828(+)
MTPPRSCTASRYVQFLVGLKCEMAWGTKTTALIYLLSGVGGNLLSSTVDPSAMGVGASGAIVGIIGARSALVFTTWHSRNPHTRNQEAIQTGFFLVMLMLFGTNSHVDNMAHLGGLLVGALIALSIWGEPAQCICQRMTQQCGQSTLRYCAVLAVVGLFSGAWRASLSRSLMSPTWVIPC